MRTEGAKQPLRRAALERPSGQMSGLEQVRAELAEAERHLSRVGRGDLPAVIGDLERLKTSASARLFTLSTSPASAATDEVLLTIPQVAARLQIGLAYAYELVRRGSLPKVQVGKKYVRVRGQDLEGFLAGRHDPFDGRLSHEHSGGHDSHGASARSQETL
jgi:excisionase family DNA binding protein